MWDDYDVDDEMAPWTDRDTDQKLDSVNLRQTAIDITGNYLAPRLGHINVMDLVIISMGMLPDSMPTHFKATNSPIPAACTEGQISHMARLLATQLTTAGLGKGMAEVQREINYYKGDEIPIPAPTKNTNYSVKDKQEEEREEHMELAQKTRKKREVSTERRREKEERNLNNPKSVRERDKDKKRRKNRDITTQRSRSMSPSRTESRALLEDRKQDSSRDRSTREAREKNDKEPNWMLPRQDPSAHQKKHNHKLIVDPVILQDLRQTIYRHDVFDPVKNFMIPMKDSRENKLRFDSKKVSADLPVSKCKIDEFDVSGISQVYIHSCITKSLNENHLIKREESFYPLKLVPLFNVDGPDQRKPFLFEKSCDRLVKEIDKLVTHKTKCDQFRLENVCYQFYLERLCFAEDEILAKYKEREISDENITISALCWFKKDLLPELHKGTSMNIYVNRILQKIWSHYRCTVNNEKYISEPLTSWQQSNMNSDCVVLYLNIKMQKPNMKDGFRDKSIISKFRHTFTICSSEAEVKKLEENIPLQVDLYNSLDDLISNLITKIKEILPRPDSTFKSVNFTIGKSTTRQKTDTTLFDSCDSNTWDTTNISSRWLTTYNNNKKREKNGRYGAYAAMIVLCVITPNMVPKHLRVKRKEDLKKVEKETTRSIQELFALTIERTLMVYFQDKPISKEVRIENKEQNNPGKMTGEFDRNGVVYLAYNRNTWLNEEELNDEDREQTKKLKGVKSTVID